MKGNIIHLNLLFFCFSPSEEIIFCCVSTILHFSGLFSIFSLFEGEEWNFHVLTVPMEWSFQHIIALFYFSICDLIWSQLQVETWIISFVQIWPFIPSPLYILFCECRELMCKEGLQSLFPMEEIAIMGLWELLPHIYSVKVLHWSVPHALLSVRMMHLTLIISLNSAEENWEYCKCGYVISTSCCGYSWFKGVLFSPVAATEM